MQGAEIEMSANNKSNLVELPSGVYPESVAFYQGRKFYISNEIFYVMTSSGFKEFYNSDLAEGAPPHGGFNSGFDGSEI